MNIYISPKREEQLRKFAEAHKKSMSSIIDTALDKFLNGITIVGQDHSAYPSVRIEEIKSKAKSAPTKKDSMPFI